MKTKFIEHYDITKLTPADYNPRKLEEDKFIKLQESLKKFGIIKPLIVNGDNNVLTAGHQRTRAIKAIGLKTAPVIKIENIKIQDEIRFNLFHNSIETNKSKVNIVGTDLKVGYCILQPQNILFKKNENSTVVNEIAKLIRKYGEWGSIVAVENGEVILNSDYAVASQQLGKEVICYVIENEKKDELLKYLSIDYGKYYYETLGIKSYNQLYCQMNRLGENVKKENKSSLYTQYVIPQLNYDMRILDFGAGKCAYANMLKNQGYKILPYEPNFQNKNQNIDIKNVVKMIKTIEKDVENNGLFDVVVLDSVLNSVVNNDVENYVLAVCNAFLKRTGKIYIATRHLNFIESKKKQKYINTNRKELEFLDKDNFSATFRNGVWTMQHFHTYDTLKKLLETYFEKVEIRGFKTSPCIYAIAERPKK